MRGLVFGSVAVCGGGYCRLSSAIGPSNRLRAHAERLIPARSAARLAHVSSA